MPTSSDLKIVTYRPEFREVFLALNLARHEPVPQTVPYQTADVYMTLQLQEQ